MLIRARGTVRQNSSGAASSTFYLSSGVLRSTPITAQEQRQCDMRRWRHPLRRCTTRADVSMRAEGSRLDWQLHPGSCRRRSRHALSCGLRFGASGRRGSAVRADLEATGRSGGAGVLPMTSGGRADIGMGCRSFLKVLCSFKPPILLIYRERASH